MTILDQSGTAAAAGSELEITVTLTRKARQAEEVVSLELQPAAGTALPAWSPGAHIDVVLPSGAVRQYSLCSDPADLSGYRVAVLREAAGRGGSQEVHDRLEEGAQLTIRGPRNHFELVPADRYVFIAGGIGITPILPMVADAAARGAEWELHYGGRTLSSMAFLDELRAHGDAVVIVPEDRDGLLDLDRILGTADGAAVYCCGPAPLLAAVEERSAQLGLPQPRIERFEAKDGALDGPTDAFEVELAASGLTLTVPADKSILEVVVDAGVYALYSCEEGICGSCETTVIDGQPDHRDSVMSPEQHDQTRTMQICVSRCIGKRLVLDL